MQTVGVLALLFVAATAETQDEKAGKLVHGLRQWLLKLQSQNYAKMKQQRRLQETCWDDCSGAGDVTDNHTVCTKPERCDQDFSDPCISDCGRTIMETLLMCETKQFCVDQEKEGACPTTLSLMEGVAENGETGPCTACDAKSSKLTPVMEMAGLGTMDMDVMKMTMGMITEKTCPNTLAAAQCAMDNADPCMDPKISSDGSFMLFAGLCECPCGRKLGKFLWDLNALTLSKCRDALKDGFKTKLPGMAEMGPILFQSGVLECFACKHNEKKCMAAFDKWLLDENLKGQLMGIFALATKCDEEPTTTTTTPATTTTTEPPVDSTSFALRSSPFLGLFAAVFATMKLA